MFVSCKAHWVAIVYEIRYINNAALPCLSLHSYSSPRGGWPLSQFSWDSLCGVSQYKAESLSSFKSHHKTHFYEKPFLWLQFLILVVFLNHILSLFYGSVYCCFFYFMTGCFIILIAFTFITTIKFCSFYVLLDFMESKYFFTKQGQCAIKH